MQYTAPSIERRDEIKGLLTNHSGISSKSSGS